MKILNIFLFLNLILAPHFAFSSQKHGVAWEYEGDKGPKHWGYLTESFSECSIGKMQSPININYNTENQAINIKTEFNESNLKVEHTGHTIRVIFDEGSSFNVNDQSFNLSHADFHTPSEHQINGKDFDMEIHLYHKTKDDKVSVLAVMVNSGKENMEFEKILEHLPEQMQSKSYRTVKFDANKIFPDNLAHYDFQGSLTSPPCSEGVFWKVFTKPIEFSPDQIKNFKKIFNMNARPLQPQNARWITTRR